MKPYLPEKSKTYSVIHHGKQFQLLLTTSVAFYKASIFPVYLRWQVIEDAEFLRNLFETSISNPSTESLESLIEMELLYKEMVSGTARAGSTEEQKRAVADEKNCAQRDLSSTGLYDAFVDVTSESNQRPTLGALVDKVRTEAGKAKFAWRTERANKKQKSKKSP